MSYIFVDESGDLGFNLKKKGTSSHFLISFLFVPTIRKRRIEKIVSKTFKTIKKPKKKSGILHAYKESPVVRQRLLKLLSQEDIKIMTICLDKSRIDTNLKKKKDILYSHVVNILLDRIESKKLVPLNEKIELIVSRRETNKFLNNNFRKYLKENNKGRKLNIVVFIKSPHREKCLQAVDFVCWSIFRKYERDDYDYYNIIKGKILEERWLHEE